jgi:hypothetical protein
MDERFATNLLRLLGAQLALQNAMSLAREMFGRAYFSLGVGERAVVDQAILDHLRGYYQAITPEFLEGQQTKQPIGFAPPPTEGSSAPPQKA